MTREEFYNQERQERSIYAGTSPDESVHVPLTRDGFEALIECAARPNNLIIDDKIRAWVVQYLHNIPINDPTLKIGDLSRVLYKVISNNLTYEIDQEIKAKAKLSIVSPIKEVKDGPQP